MNRRSWIVFFLYFIALSAHSIESAEEANVLSRESQDSTTNTSMHIGDVQLGELLNSGEIHTYRIEPPFSHPKASLRIFGHIYQADRSGASYLKQPWIRLERHSRRDGIDDWKLMAESHAPGEDIEVAHIQNFSLNDAFSYRISAGTDSHEGGRYALIADPVEYGSEIEIEDLDFGLDPRGRKNSLSAAYIQSDPTLLNGSRVYIGTEEGYLLVSEDDAQTWKTIHPPAGTKPHGSIYGLFVDSQGIIYLSEWTSQYDAERGFHGALMESRDKGNTWTEAIDFQWPTGVAWRICEDHEGNVFVGEYAATWMYKDSLTYTGNIWRRKNYGVEGETFEIVFANPTLADGPFSPGTISSYAWVNNHVHFVGEDPYTGAIYATMGDNLLGRFVRSQQHGDPGTWETLERGVDSQYTSIVFTPDYLFLGQDTNNPYKKIVRWDKNWDRVEGGETYWTSEIMDDPTLVSPIPYTDRGNWFWGHYLDRQNLMLFQYLPYGVDTLKNGQTQSPRLYLGINYGAEWRRAISFPPLPISDNPRSGFYGPKMSSNIGPDGWIYAMRGTVSDEIHRGFRFRLKTNGASGIQTNWEQLK